MASIDGDDISDKKSFLRGRLIQIRHALAFRLSRALTAHSDGAIPDIDSLSGGCRLADYNVDLPTRLLSVSRQCQHRDICAANLKRL